MQPTSSRPLAVLDCEVYRDYFLCKIRRLDNRQVRVFEQYEGHRLDTAGLRSTLERVTSITFNGRNYDMPILGLALTGASCETLKRCSDFIIQGNMRPWDAERQFGFRVPACDHIDLIEVVPGMVSLKVYAGRLHVRRMQDLPIPHDASIEPHRRPIILDYNDLDLDATEALFNKFKSHIELRIEMSREYKIDLRSKSDAQIAEAVIKRTLEDRGVAVVRPELRARAFKFRFPNFLKNAGPIVNEIIEMVRQSDFIVEPSGYVRMPPQLAEAKIKIGQSVYRMGLGGLHSSEKKQAIVANDDWIIEDNDVASFYPAIKIETSLFPRHLGRAYLDVYRDIRDRRLVAKRAGDSIKANTLKILLNGAFGKLGNPWSVLYSPELLIQVTLTGQLSLLMLIEMIESAGGAKVVSANTDGIVIYCHRGHYETMRGCIKQWETWTNFETEATQYKALYSRDVNSYVALKAKGGAKLKGAYSEPEPVASSWPSPHMQICVTAVCDYLEHGIPLDLTIKACMDIRQFIEVRNVTGGGQWRGEYLGRAVRWYKAINGEPVFKVKANKSGNHDKVAGTDGCRPLMLMDGSMPDDIDYDAYVREAEAILKEIGAC